MNQLPASAGWSWIKEGFALFSKQPIELSTLFLAYMFLILALNLVPLAGPIAALVLTPTFAMSFMQACVDVGRGKRVHPGLLLTGFRSPAFRTLLLLGLMYLIAALIASATFALLDDGTLQKIMERKIAINSPEVQNSRLLPATLLALAVYTPAAMAFWFAAPLIAWKEMKVGKAMFFSFFAVWRATRPFLVYGLGLIGVMFALFFVLGLLALLTGSNQIINMLIVMPSLIAFWTVVFCSFYPGYTDIFGKPDGATDTNSRDSLSH